MEEKYLTVSALTRYIKYKFDYDTNLKEVLIEGEISNFKHHSRGHFYFTLKDEASQIGCMMFAAYARNVKFFPKDGDKVYLKGYVTVYEQGGYYQLVVLEMKNSGIGDLYLEFERLNKELKELGYYDQAHKKPIPRFPKAIGVITSPTGAVIRDIINTIRRRYPFLKLILYPTLVQGNDAKNDIVRSIKRCNADALVDVIILGRGGGSLEDLWPFNERIVADAIYDSKLPIISAVGHETDFTISDFVADLRAATPTAAAELATPSVIELTKEVDFLKNSLIRLNTVRFNELKFKLSNLERLVDSYNPMNKLKEKRRYIDNYKKNLNLLIQNKIDLNRSKYESLAKALSALSPVKVMERGYAIVKQDNKAIKSIKQINKGEELETIMNDGKIISVVKEVYDGK